MTTLFRELEREASLSGLVGNAQLVQGLFVERRVEVLVVDQVTGIECLCPLRFESGIAPSVAGSATASGKS